VWACNELNPNQQFMLEPSTLGQRLRLGQLCIGSDSASVGPERRAKLVMLDCSDAATLFSPARSESDRSLRPLKEGRCIIAGSRFEPFESLAFALADQVSLVLLNRGEVGVHFAISDASGVRFDGLSIPAHAIQTYYFSVREKSVATVPDPPQRYLTWVLVALPLLVMCGAGIGSLSYYGWQDWSQARAFATDDEHSSLNLQASPAPARFEDCSFGVSCCWLLRLRIGACCRMLMARWTTHVSSCTRFQWSCCALQI
jgi:hypothetical protein